MIKVADDTTRPKLMKLYNELCQEEYPDDNIYRIDFFLKQEDLSNLYEIIVDNETVEYIASYKINLILCVFHEGIDRLSFYPFKPFWYVYIQNKIREFANNFFYLMNKTVSAS